MINAIFEGIFHGSMYTLGFAFLLILLHMPILGPVMLAVVLDHYNLFKFTGEAFWGFSIVVWVYQIWFFYQLAKRVD